MHVLIIQGSPRKNSNTKKVTEKFLNHLKTIIPDLNITTHTLTQKNIQFCTGCYNCLRKGLNTCPHNDDVLPMYKQMKASDGIILTTPVYLMHVTAQMKKFLDRLSPLCHRPELQNQQGMAIVTTGGIGEKTVGKYLSDMLSIWGCQSSEMLALKTPPNKTLGTDSIQDHLPIIHKKAEHYAKRLVSTTPPKPSFTQLMQFRMQKKIFTQPETKEIFPADYHFWTTRPYKTYHVNARINPLTNMTAALIEKIMGPFI